MEHVSLATHYRRHHMFPCSPLTCCLREKGCCVHCTEEETEAGTMHDSHKVTQPVEPESRDVNPDLPDAREPQATSCHVVQ